MVRSPLTDACRTEKTAIREPIWLCMRVLFTGLSRSGLQRYTIQHRTGHEPSLCLVITSRHTGISGESPHTALSGVE
jgi:hypothetical protein